MKNKITLFLKLETSKNILWLFGDKVLRLGLGLIVGVVVARHLGPELFGKWNYAIAFISLISALSTLGLDQIVVKKLLQDKNEEHTLLGSAFFLRLIGSLLSTIIVFIYFSLIKNDSQLLIVATLTVFNLWFQSSDIIDLKNQSVLQSKKTVIVKNTSFVIISTLRILFVYLNFSLIAFSILALVESILSAVGLILFYGIGNLKKWKINIEYCKSLLKQSYPLILSGIIIMMYMRIDQIMIGEILGNKSTGLYSISTRFTELFYFIPSIFVTSFFPKLIEKYNKDRNEYYSNSIKLFKLLFIFSLTISIFFTFSADTIINFLYGEKYQLAVNSLCISIWTGIFVFWGVAAGNILVIENLNKHNLNKSIHGLVINVILNIFLIPKFGINGAAIATLISQFYASYLYYFLFKKTRHIFILQSKSILIFK